MWILVMQAYFSARKLSTRKGNLLKEISLSCKKHCEATEMLCFHYICPQENPSIISVEFLTDIRKIGWDKYKRETKNEIHYCFLKFLVCVLQQWPWFLWMNLSNTVKDGNWASILQKLACSGGDWSSSFI